MTSHSFRTAVFLPLVLALAACEQSKSANPLSPLIAGPIAGVEIGTPVLLEPTASRQFSVDQQPVTLVVENAGTNGVRPVFYHFQVATDALFSTLVYQTTGVEQGTNGRTTHQLPDALSPERTYYWRAKADDGANASGYTAARSFLIFTPVVIGAPTLRLPTDGSTVTTRKPTLVVQNAIRTGPAGRLIYRFEASDTVTMATTVASIDVEENPSGETTFVVPSDLPYATRYFWRVRASDPGHTGPWSPISSFVTPAAPPPPTPPPPTPPPGPAPGDELDLNSVTWAKGVVIAGWEVTSTVTRAYHSGSDLCIEHTKAGRWPALPFFDYPDATVEGNQIMIANIGGKWYGGAGEWLRPGQVCKGLDGHVGQNNFYGAPPLDSWTPSPGELIGLAVSTPSRVGQWGTAERSNVVLIRW